MYAIACLDKNGAIGKDGKLLVSIPDDMKFFRETTKDSIVVMGRKTLFSFKDKMPLKNRINVVFTNNDFLNEEYKGIDNIFFVKNEVELNDVISKYSDKKVFVIGGAKIYSDLIDKCEMLYITRVDKSYDADTYFPDIDKYGFMIFSESEIKRYEDITYRFMIYKKCV